MKKIQITQQELNYGYGNFHLYMNMIRENLISQGVEQYDALTAATTLITNDGHKIESGSNSNLAGLSVANWLLNFYDKKRDISYCFPSVAYQINGVIYRLCMPVVKGYDMSLIEAITNLTADVARKISEEQLEIIKLEYNEFYREFYRISYFDVTTLIHFEAAAERLLSGAAYYALSRWETLHFIKRAMWEILEHKGVKRRDNSDKDEISVIYKQWITAGLSPLPMHLLMQVICSPSIRYQKGPHSFLATINAHHASIRLAGLIAREFTIEPVTKGCVAVEPYTLFREGSLAVARVFHALSNEEDERRDINITHLL